MKCSREEWCGRSIIRAKTRVRWVERLNRIYAAISSTPTKAISGGKLQALRPRNVAMSGAHVVQMRLFEWTTRTFDKEAASSAFPPASESLPCLLCIADFYSPIIYPVGELLSHKGPWCRFHSFYQLRRCSPHQIPTQRRPDSDALPPALSCQPPPSRPTKTLLISCQHALSAHRL
jgi:hypothetical protein